MTTLAALLVAAITTAGLLGWLLHRRVAAHRGVLAQLDQLQTRFRPVVDIDAELARIQRQIDSESRSAAVARKQAEDTLAAQRQAHEQTLHALLQRQASTSVEIDQLAQRRERLAREVSALDEEAHLQEVGLYRKHFDFPSSHEFDVAIARVEQQQKEMVKAGRAAICTTTWSVAGSEKEGEKFVARLLKLMLRAFNAECDAAVAKVRYNNIEVMETRITKSCEAINKLTTIQQCHITGDYLKLRLDELHLVHEQHERIQEEKEEQRRIREQIREEEIAQRELDKARQDAEREEQRYEDALAKARAEVAAAQGAKQEKLNAKIAELEVRLAEAHEQKERAISRAQLTRSGHVYVISNIGSFGERVFKIGMTRRLDPQERIKELGDASVPFAFDVHAVIYTEDAPGLETKLHHAFSDRRINLVNERKEFFAVEIDEVVRVVRENHGDVLITKAAEAEEYRKTVALLAERGVERPGWGHYDRRSAVRTANTVGA